MKKVFIGVGILAIIAGIIIAYGIGYNFGRAHGDEKGMRFARGACIDLTDCASCKKYFSSIELNELKRVGLVYWE